MVIQGVLSIAMRGRTRCTSIILTFLLAIFLAPAANSRVTGAATELIAPPHVTAAALYVFDATLGTALYALNADERRSPASTTKIASALVVVQQISDLDETVEIVASDVISIDAGESIMGLTEGDVLTVRQLLNGLLIKSGNDAALALARFTGSRLLDAEGVEGDPWQRFVVAMNDLASDLDLGNTHFTNPAGLYDSEHFTTARELGTLATTALNNSDIAAIVNQKETTFSSLGPEPQEYVLTNTNQLLEDENVTGIKTGTVPESGACLVASKVGPDGDVIIGVVLGSDVAFDQFGVIVPDSDQRYSDMRALFVAMETDYRWMNLDDLGQFPGLDDELSAWQVAMKPAGAFILPASEADQIRYRLQLLEAGKPDAEVGRVYFYAGDQIVAESPLVQQ